MRYHPAQKQLIITLSVFLITGTAGAKKIDATAQAKEIIDITGVKGGFVVHLGCGDGRVMYEIMDRHKNHKFHLTGVDFSPHMLRKAKKRNHVAAKKNSHRVSFICQDCMEYLEECEEKKYDVVIASFLLSYVKNSELFPLVHKVLKKGGKFVILTNSDEHLRCLEKVFFKFFILHPFLSNWFRISKFLINQRISRILPHKKTIELLKKAKFSKVKSKNKPIFGCAEFDDPASFLRWMHGSVWSARYSCLIKESKGGIFFDKAAKYLEKKKIKIVGEPVTYGKPFTFFFPVHSIIAEK